MDDDEHFSTPGRSADGAPPSPAYRRFAWPAAAGVLALVVALMTGYILGTRGDTRPTPVAAPAMTTATTTASVVPSTTVTPTSVVPPAATAPVQPCGVDLTAQAVRDAVRRLPVEPLTGGTFSTAGVSGNYDPCATLSTALVTIEGATGSSPVQALMFHDGQYLGTGTSDAYGFTSLNPSVTVDDTVALDYKTPGSCNACSDGTVTTVRYQWDGSQVQMLDALPQGDGAAGTSPPGTTEPVCRGVNCPAPGVVGNVGGPRSRGVPLVSCPPDQEYGSGLYADGQLDYAPECLPGGSGGR